MTGSAVDEGTQAGRENAGQMGGESTGEAAGQSVGTSAKQNAGGGRKPAGVRYLSDFIAEIPETRRIRFISHLKEAIREELFDGCPTAETFELTYTRRSSQGPEECRTEQRDFVVESASAFKTWMAGEVTAPNTKPKYPTRPQFEGGQVSLAEMAAKFRRRGSTGQKRKAKK